MNRSTTRTSLAATISLLAVVAAAPAVASPTREDVAPGTSSEWTYAHPLDALDGMSLAQYLAEHMADDPRLR